MATRWMYWRGDSGLLYAIRAEPWPQLEWALSMDELMAKVREKSDSDPVLVPRGTLR